MSHTTFPNQTLLFGLCHFPVTLRFYSSVLLLPYCAALQELLCLFTPAAPQRQLPQISCMDEEIFVLFQRIQTPLQCHSHPRTGWRQCAPCSPLTCRNRWAWDNALGAVPGQSGEPGVAGNSVAVSRRMCCRLLLGYTACREKRRETLDAQCLWVCRFRRYFGLLLKAILAGICQDRQQAHTSTCWGFWARANTCWE